MLNTSKIAPCLWFDGQAEEAANFYISIFPNSKITEIARYADAGQEVHGKAAGSVMTVAFELDGQSFTGLNGGPIFQFNEAVSFQVMCDSQDEVDYYWHALTSGGAPQAQQCGWLKDKFGLSWQVIPKAMIELYARANSQQGARMMQAIMGMQKLSLSELQKAFDG